MMIKNKLLVDLSGAPIRSGEVEMTVAAVLVNCALMPEVTGKGYPANQVASRYDIAVKLNNLAVDESIDMPVELVAALKADVLRAYAPIIAGQMLIALESSH